MPLQVYANYAMGPPQVGFSFRVESPTILFFICLVSVLVYAFWFQVQCWIPYSPIRAQPLGFPPLQPFGAYPWQAYVQPGDGHQPTLGMQRVATPSTALSHGGTSCYSISCPSAIPTIWWGIQLWGLGRVTQSLHIPCMVGRGLLFLRFSSMWWHR